jgi:hypothetical protein
MVPSVPPILLILIPAVLMAVSVVREKELGSIINFYVTPTPRLEFFLALASWCAIPEGLRKIERLDSTQSRDYRRRGK